MEQARGDTSNDPPMSPTNERRNELLDFVEKHVLAEAASIEAYRELAVRTSDPLAALVLQMILSDEEHHHTTLIRLARMLQSDSQETQPPSFSVKDALSEKDRLLLKTAIQDETDGARQLRAIASEHSDRYEGLVALILELMARDSEKHEIMLRFALSRTEGRYAE